MRGPLRAFLPALGLAVLPLAAEGGLPQSPLIFGASADGGLGAKLAFNRIGTLGAWSRDGKGAEGGWTGTLYWGARADGVWSSRPGARDSAEAALEIGFGNDFETATAVHGLTLAFDLKGQYANGEAGAGAHAPVNGSLYGPKLVYRLSWAPLNGWLQRVAHDLGEAPTVTAGFYRRRGAAGTPPLPERLRADEAYAQFRFSTPLIPLQRAQAVMLAILVQATRPLQGADRATAHFLDASLTLSGGGAVRPVITYRSGEKDGLAYDRQLLLGLLFDLGKP